MRISLLVPSEVGGCFFKRSRSSFTVANSRLSRSSSASYARPWLGAKRVPSFLALCISRRQRLSTGSCMPNAAIARNDLSPHSANRTASTLNSGVKCRRSLPILSSIVAYLFVHWMGSSENLMVVDPVALTRRDYLASTRKNFAQHQLNSTWLGKRQSSTIKSPEEPLDGVRTKLPNPVAGYE